MCEHLNRVEQPANQLRAVTQSVSRVPLFNGPMVVTVMLSFKAVHVRSVLVQGICNVGYCYHTVTGEMCCNCHRVSISLTASSGTWPCRFLSSGLSAIFAFGRE